MTSCDGGDDLFDATGDVHRRESQLVVRKSRLIAGGVESRLGGGRFIDETNWMLDRVQAAGRANRSLSLPSNEYFAVET